MNEDTQEFYSGLNPATEGQTHWLVKFDGVKGSQDEVISGSEGFGCIEYAYCLMEKAAGIEMSESRLFEEGGLAHFMTKRFDRTQNGEKIGDYIVDFVQR